MSASSTIRRLLSALLALLVLIVLGFSAQLAVSRGGLDFVQFYFAGQLAAHGEIASIHDPEIYAPMIAELSERDDRITTSAVSFFNRPAFAAFFYVPLSFLSFQQALISWQHSTSCCLDSLRGRRLTGCYLTNRSTFPSEFACSSSSHFISQYWEDTIPYCWRYCSPSAYQTSGMAMILSLER